MNNPLGRILRQTLLKLGGQAAPQQDADLLERFVTARDEAAFEQIVRRHGPMVWRVGQRVLRQTQDVEDVFQATFVVLARKAGDIARPELLGGWLHGVAHRVALEARAQRARREARQQSLTAESAIPDQSVTPPDGDWRTILDAEIARLPEKYRLPLVLCDLEGLTCDEAARRLGIPTGTIKKRRFQVRNLLRERLARRGVTCSVASLATVLAQEATAAVPDGGVLALTGLPGAAHGGAAVGSAALDLAQVYLQGQVRRRWWRAAGLTVLAGILGSVATIGVHGLFNAREATSQPLHVVWRFEQGPAPDLAAERGAWVHRALGPGAMVSNRAVVVLPAALPERPFAVTVQWKPVQGGGANSGSSRVMPVWAHEGQAVPRRVWAAVWQDSWNAQSVIRSRAVFQGRWSALYIDGKLTALNQYDSPYPARRVLLAIQNAAVEEIELKELALDAVPPELQNAALIARTLVPGLTNDL